MCIRDRAQAALFSESGMVTEELCAVAKMSEPTMSKKRKRIKEPVSYTHLERATGAEFLLRAKVALRDSGNAQRRGILRCEKIYQSACWDRCVGDDLAGQAEEQRSEIYKGVACGGP